MILGGKTSGTDTPDESGSAALCIAICVRSGKRATTGCVRLKFPGSTADSVYSAA